MYLIVIKTCKYYIMIIKLLVLNRNIEGNAMIYLTSIFIRILLILIFLLVIMNIIVLF